MELRRILQDINGLHDLPSLFGALGLDPLWHRVAGLGNGRSAVPASVVARSGGFPWFAFESDQPERTARAQARRLESRGQVAGVVAIDAVARRIVLSVGFGDAPALTVSLDSPARVALASLRRIGWVTEEGSLAYAARVADALSAEEAGARFFREFGATLERMTAELAADRPASTRRSFVLLQLTRVLFLYFVQAKGWLGGRERFLAEQLDRCLSSKRSIHRHMLRPLFFGTLNRPFAERGRAAVEFGAVPFLNGGLFEPHQLEREFRRDIPNASWAEAFDSLFERFQFTVREDAAGGDIAPDMLGRVFEGLMAPDARRASGTYYTPAALVRQIIDAALRASRAGRRGGPSTGEPLTILDPAVGSGAFLLGALERLAAEGRKGRESESARRRQVLQRSLFGVDRSATAVRLAELRLWLAVIADDHTERPSSVQPLPNLDCLVRQGDSLFDPVGSGVRLDFSDPLTARIAEVRRGVVTAVGQGKRALVRELCELERRAAAQSLASAQGRIDAGITECLSAARSRDLFGERRGLDSGLKERLAGLRVERRAVREAHRTLHREGELPWFHYESQFADVFAAGGFDLVVGNPPWLRAEQLPPAQRRRLSGRYRWWRGGGEFGNRPDLSVAFLERAVELAAPGGVIALLLPAKVATARYGAAARHALATTTTLINVADLTGHPDATFDATVYPLAIVARNAPPPAGHRLRTSLGGTGGQNIAQSSLAGGGPWILSGGGARRIVGALCASFPRFGDQLSCHLGLKTGANAIFLDPPDSVESELVRYAIRGRDVRPFRTVARSRLLYTHGADGRPLPSLPPSAAAHLAPHLSVLRARADFDGGVPWTLFRTRAATASHRVVWPDLARQLTAAALTVDEDRRAIPLNSCYVTVAGSEAQAERIAAWLNCTWIRAAARMGAVPAASGFARFGAVAVGGVPLPTAVLAESRLDTLSRSAREGAQVQDELDDIAARHLGLSASDQDALRSVVGVGATRRR